MPTKNPYPWPKIVNVAATLQHQVEMFCLSCSFAADLIAKRYILHKKQYPKLEQLTTWKIALSKWKAHRRKKLSTCRDLNQYFTSIPIVATQKYGGTNVGVSEEGLMLGRRLIISSDASTYQGTTLKNVKSALTKVKMIKDAILKDIISENETASTSLHCSIYGELMCNEGRFDYANRGLGGAFTCFGLILRANQVCS